MKGPINRFLFKLVLFTLPFGIGFCLLFRLNLYPIVTRSELFDYKMMQAQRHHIRDVKLLSIGSSVALFDLNSAVITDHFHLPYYNFSSFGMQMADTRVVLDALVREYRPSYVLLLSSVWDYMTPYSGTYARYTGVPVWIREHFPEYFYVADFHSIHSIFTRSRLARHPDFDRWGGGSIGRMRDGIVFKGQPERLILPTAYTEREYGSLDSLAAFLQEQKVKLIFVQTPIKAAYLDTAGAQERMRSYLDRCRSIVEAHDGKYLNYQDTTVFTDSLFADMSHLSPAGAVFFTKRLAADLRGIIQQ